MRPDKADRERASSGKLRHERQYKGDGFHGSAGARRRRGVTDTYQWYLGIDWGSAEHRFCIVDERGRVCGERAVAHTTSDVHAALDWVRDRTGAAPPAIAVGLETPHGLLVDTLLEQGFGVFAINPKQLDRFRDRFTAGGAKDDRRDAHVVADSLRTDRRAFRAVHADDPAIIQLRELSRLLHDLQVEEGRLANRLRDQLSRVHAPWLMLSPAADDQWLWTLLRDTPHPDGWPQLPRRRIRSVLQAHRIRRLTADDVVAALRQPTLTVAPGVTDAAAIRIGAVIPQLLLVHEQRTTTERQIDRLLAQLAAADAGEDERREHRDVQILQSLPGVGRVVTATMLAEAAGPLAARDYGTLRAYTGVAPVTKRSGKHVPTVQMRYACKHRLREALYHWCRTSIQCDIAARTYYRQLRARGHSHGRALRSVGDRWLRILIAMLNARTLYDATRFEWTEPATA
jgi:transposase